MKKARNITSRDIAKVIGVEKEYNDALIEVELKKTRENFLNTDVENINLKINENDNNVTTNEK